MSTSPPSKTTNYERFNCECEVWMRNACRDEGFYREQDGKHYCVLHYPGTEKKADFQRALEDKLNKADFDFRGVWFPDEANFYDFIFESVVTFTGAHFNSGANFINVEFKAEVSFLKARFEALAYFTKTHFRKDVEFLDTQFSSSAFFSLAEFHGAARFGSTTFSGSAEFDAAQFYKVAYFERAQFMGVTDFSDAKFYLSATFDYAQFGANVSFERTAFKADDRDGKHPTVEDQPHRSQFITFTGATFSDRLLFENNRFANGVFISFAATTFEKPERIAFHSSTLRPHWFVDMDSRKINFINVDWGFLDNRNAISNEVRALEKAERPYLTRLLEITFRQLAVNAEENNRYEEAANFRYMAMDMRRRQRWRKVDLFRIHWWYWVLSGYGEKVQRAFIALISIWLVFAVIYWSGNTTWWQPKQPRDVGPKATEPTAQINIIAQPFGLRDALVYSASVMALQKPEPMPANKRAKSFVLFETIFGPLQAALLALAIRRKFMR